MTRTITPAEIKPGMTIRWTHNKVTYECPVMDRDGTDEDGGVLCHVSDMHSEYVDAEAGEVTVLAEPQPEEPVTLCARIVVAGRKIYRWTEDPKEPWPWRGEALNVDPVLWSWGQLSGLGHVTVVDAAPSWTAPADREPTPEVPDRIEEWPEDDTELRKHKWRGRDGYIWKWLAAASEWECYDAVGNGMVSGGRPSYGPWTRATDA